MENRVSRAFANKKFKNTALDGMGVPGWNWFNKDLQLKPCFLLFCFQYFL